MDTDFLSTKISDQQELRGSGPRPILQIHSGRWVIEGEGIRIRLTLTPNE